MPGGDRTGPMGMGPMTGRAAGYCAGFPAPGYMNPIPGRGFWGRGRGGGRGRRNWFYATGLTGWQRAAWGPPGFAPAWGYGAPWAQPFAPAAMGPEQELDLLRRQAEGFAGTLDELKKRIAELEAETQRK